MISRRRVRTDLARTLALLGAAAQVVAVFLPWDGSGRAALDLPIGGSPQPTVGALLVAFAALAAVPALVAARVWPPLLSGALTAVLVVVWVGRGPDGALAAGVVAALVAGGLHLVAAALGPTEGLSPRATPPARPRSSSGFRQVDHTADVAFEAWGPDRASCFAAAVAALVDSFADTSGERPRGGHPVDLRGERDEDVLVDLLDEVIYLLDAHGAVTVEAVLEDHEDGRLTGQLRTVPVRSVRPAGAVPKATTLHGLAVERTAVGWRCRVTVDV